MPVLDQKYHFLQVRFRAVRSRVPQNNRDLVPLLKPNTSRAFWGMTICPRSPTVTVHKGISPLAEFPLCWIQYCNELNYLGPR